MHPKYPNPTRLSDGVVPLWEEDTGDGERAAGEFHVLERLQRVFPIHVSLSLLQASVHQSFRADEKFVHFYKRNSIPQLTAAGDTILKATTSHQK